MKSLSYKGQYWKVGDLVKGRDGRCGYIVGLNVQEYIDVYVSADVIWQDGEKLSFSLNYLELVNG